VLLKVEFILYYAVQYNTNPLIYDCFFFVIRFATLSFWWFDSIWKDSWWVFARL